ncbi:cyanase [Malassezia japonica]|uniref:Cyanate hydratase n=1 Tax=Malassezia japonica TaxID=223818 RepID=A0AAF0F3T9_9BASI|nr:cyanase [Malassezia japonica]WFD40280.1 cyanase [Malassezia japonica]
MTPETPTQHELEVFLDKLRLAKAKSNLTFADLAEKLERDELYVAAIFYGQAKPEKKDLDKINEALSINWTENYLGKDYFPTRAGLDKIPPEDPVLYRLYEALMVYGRPIKHIINEKFGDGIMSAIDFRGHVERVEDPNGPRVKITLDGKFLPYRRW